MPDSKNAVSVPASPPAVAGERELIRRCNAGDEDAWRALYDQHFPRVERLVGALGLVDVEADDVCQDIFLLIHRHLPRFRGEAQLSTWIHRLATREAIRHAKKKRLRRLLVDLFVREHHATAAPAWADSAPGRHRYLQDLLGRLSPERRLALVMYEIEGVSVGEIARISNCAEGTIWTRLHRARRDLEKMSKDKTP